MDTILTWEYPALAGLQKFNIYKYQTPGGHIPGQYAVSVAADKRTVTFTGLPPGIWYFVVTALVSLQESGPSNEVSKNVPLPVPTNLTVS